MTTTDRARHDPEKWLDEYGDRLFRFALARVGDPHVAEDLVQETFVSAIRSLPTFQGQSEILTWLTSILRRRISDHFQKQAQSGLDKFQTVDRLVQADDIEFANSNHTLYYPRMNSREFDTALERNEFSQALQECLSRLPVALREVFVLRMMDEGQTVDEICDRLGLTRNHVGVRLYRARLLLRKCLERQWMEDES